MKTQILALLLAGTLTSLAAWLVHEPSLAQAEEVPEEYRNTVRKGLDYLLKNQCQDGRWEGDGGKHPTAMTGLVGLALLMEEPRKQGQYTAGIAKAVDWLMARSQGRDGLIFSEHPSETDRYMQGHGLATLFLTCFYSNDSNRERQEKLHEILGRAVKYAVKAQSTQGGWYHTSRAEGHDLDAILPTVILVQALHAAEIAGIPVSIDPIELAQDYLRKALAKYDEQAKPGKNSSRPGDTAAALACRTGWNPTSKDDVCAKWLKFCQTEIPAAGKLKFGRDELAHFYYAQAVFETRDWNTYRTALFNHLQNNQNKDGSWPAPLSSQGGISTGSVYATALWCTVLQIDTNNHPTTRRFQGRD